MSTNFKSSNSNNAKSIKSNKPNLASLDEDFNTLQCAEHRRVCEAYDMQRGTYSLFVTVSFVPIVSSTAKAKATPSSSTSRKPSKR